MRKKIATRQATTVLSELPEDIAASIRQHAGVKANDTSKDKELSQESSAKLFERWCEWEGLIGYADTIRDTLRSIRSAKKSA